jgi:Toxin co-regulated pilus biosynthesis protein Q
MAHTHHRLEWRRRARRWWLSLAWAGGWASTMASPMPAVPSKGLVGMDLAVEWVNHHQNPVYAKPTWVQVLEPSSEGEAQPWQVRLQDKTLSQTLFRWAQTAGWQIQWDAERDHPIEASFQIEATFVQALKIVMESLADSEYPLQAVLNPQTRSMRIVRHNESPRR